jgi:putative FmdB family regulatory protein
MIYEYKCKECEEIWEETLPLSKYDKPIKSKCPHCDAKKGNVFRHISTAPSMKMDSNYKIDQPHDQGGFQEAMKRVVNSPGVKGTPEAEKLKAKHIG